jgi:hypothetical protein
MKKYKSLNEFYSYYLKDHQNYTCRVLHFIGTTLFFVVIMGAFLFHKLSLLWLCPLFGYGFAWVGHFFFEKNKPATFQYPLYSLLSDFKLYFEIIAGKEKFNV